MRQRKFSRRSFLETALAGGAAGVASLTITKDLFAQASGPIVIGHHCDLTGVISSWGYWHDKCAKAAIDAHQQGRRHRRPQGRAGDRGHRVEPGARRAQAAQPDPTRQCRVHRRLGAFRRDAGGAADRDRAQDPVFLDRRSDRGDRLEGNALLVPHRHRHLFDRCRQHALVRRQPGQGLVDHLRRLRLGPEHEPGVQALHREGRRQGAHQHSGAARHQGLRALPGADSGRLRGRAAGVHRLARRSPSTRRRRPWASTRR